MDYWMKMAASGSSTTAFGFAMNQISKYEDEGVGLQWGNAHTPSNIGQVRKTSLAL